MALVHPRRSAVERATGLSRTLLRALALREPINFYDSVLDSPAPRRYASFATFAKPRITTSLRSATLAGQQKRHLSIQELDQEQRGRQRVVVLGSGWGGYPLARALDNNKFQVILVSPRSYFVFTPLLASTCVGTLEFRTALEPVRSRRNKAAYFQAWGNDVNFHDKTVTIEEAVVDPRQGLAPLKSRFEGMTPKEVEDRQIKKSAEGRIFTLSYDKLVIGVGAYSQTFSTPGVKEHANFLKDVGDSRKIRKRILECFETASLPTVSDEVRKDLLRFVVVGGGPTGMEFSAELFDFIHEELPKLYADLTRFCSIYIYDVAPNVLSAFDESLSKYATETFQREGITIKTSKHPKKLSAGLPGSKEGDISYHHGLTLNIDEEGDIGCGMCVWSTGLMMNPFVERALTTVRNFPASEVIYKAEVDHAEKAKWSICRDQKTGSIVTNDRLRVILTATEDQKEPVKAAYMKDVFAIGDCATVEGTAYPATAQVANQKAEWLARRLNKEDLHKKRFSFMNLGIMAYLGNHKAIVQGGGGVGNISGRAAWLIWRGAYLVKSMSWRNRILIPIYWLLNSIFGRDVSRF